MTTADRELLLVAADALDLVQRRGDDAADEALAMVVHALRAVGEARSRGSEAFTTIVDVLGALTSTPSGAAARGFLRRYEARAGG